MQSEMVNLHLKLTSGSEQSDAEYSKNSVERAITYRVHFRALKRKQLREPDLWWEHVSIVRGESTDLGDMWDWHKRQLERAITLVSTKYPGGLQLLPASGFYVQVGRWLQTYRDGKSPQLITIASIWEDDTRDLIYPKHRRTIDAVVHGVIDKTEAEALGTDYNPLPRILEEVVSRLPDGWRAYLKWRGHHRQKPEAEWLVKLRAEGRKSRRNLSH
jgi:hypothetical protein